jgi:uncharacterized protein (DUF58 family)
LDWKSSARGGTLLLRRAEASIAPTTTIALAFGSQDYEARVLGDVIERAATAAASLAVALLQRKLPVGLVANGHDPQSGADGVALRPAKGDEQRHQLLHLIGRLQVGGADLWTLLRAQALPWGGTTVVVLSDLFIDVLPELTALRRRGQQLVVMLVDSSQNGRVLARQQQNITTYIVDRQGTPIKR